MGHIELSILYAEDEHIMANNVSTFFKNFGHKMVHATDATMAIKMSEKQKFNIMIFDIHLESGTGDQVIERIRADVGNPNHKTPILVVSSHLDGPLITKLSGKIQGAVVKPFKIMDLIKRVEELLDVEIK